MREILFRGKRIDDGEWVEGGYFVEPYTDKRFIIRWNSFGLGFNEFIEVSSDAIGQYTGLKDKNGQRIFEGDILKEDYIFSGKHVLHVVAFCESSFGTRRFVSGKLSDVCIPFDDCENPMCAERETEVIGNIHDNPKLLKEGAK